MFKRVVLTMVVLALSTSLAVADMGVFDYSQDIGDTKGYGYVTTLPGTGPNQDYVITGGGGDIWGNADAMHMAYNLVDGDVRVSASGSWILAENGWAKWGPMIRSTTDADSIYGAALTSYTQRVVTYQSRTSTGAGSNGVGNNDPFQKLGIQKKTLGGFTVVEGLVDYGSGWQLIPDSSATIYSPGVFSQVSAAGIAVTSHDNNKLAQALVQDVMYETDFDLLTQFPTVTGAGAEACSDIPGFQITVMNPETPDGWGYAAAQGLFDGTTTAGILLQKSIEAGMPIYSETRIDPVVNLRDTGGSYTGDDRSFPGIDNYEFPAADPADGDDDDNFATQAIACIYLTAGWHVIGADSDDGTIVTIGGVEVGRTAEWKGAGTPVDFLFEVAEEGWYDFAALSLEGGGGSSFELQEVFSDGTRILLGAQDDQGNFIGSPVYAPEPATIALLGLGGLSLLRRKRS